MKSPFSMIVFLSIILLSIISSFPLLAQLVPDFRVNQVPATLNLLFPSVAIDGQGNFNIVWTDLRRQKGSNRTLFNIYCQRYNYNAEALGKNFRVNLNPDTANAPSIAIQKSGRFAVCWIELSMGWNRLYFRLFKNDGTPLASVIKLSDTTGDIEKPSIAVNQKGLYTVTWRHRINTNQPYMILHQKIDSLGNKIGNNIRVDDFENSNKERPAITVRRDNSFIITWDDQRIPGANPHIYMQMFNPDGNPVGANQRVSEITDPLDMHIIPKISSDSTGNFIIAWFDSRGGLFPDIRNYAQPYNRNGQKIGDNFRLLDIIEPARNVISKLDDGRYIFGTDYSININTRRAIMQRFDSSNVKIGGIYALSNQVPGTNQDYQDVKIFGDRIISVWLDNRNGPPDVYCNIRSFQNPDSVLSNINLITSEVPESFELYQNYPNPFNPNTVITYQLSMAANVRLSVHDMLGREVVILVNENQNAGKYNVRFPNNVYQFSTGIYFYRIEARQSAYDGESLSVSFIQTKKMILLK